ncbi:hypothetical protein ACLKA6_007364 [Drosophila palustris]
MPQPYKASEASQKAKPSRELGGSKTAGRLRHVLVLEPNWTRNGQIESYEKLLANYMVQFFIPQMGANFKEQFYYEAPRTALFVKEFESDIIKRWVFQAASEEGFFNNSQAWFMLGSSRANRTDESIIEEHLSAYSINIDADITLTEKPQGYDDLSYLGNDRQLLQLDPMQRKTFQLFKLMEQMFNLSLDVRFTDNWGSLQPNGSWSGVMGQITSGEAHFALCPMQFVQDRQRYVQYSPVLHTQPINFLFRHPRRNSIRNIFFEPLSTQVWWCVLALVVCSTLLLPLHVNLERRQHTLQRHLPEGEGKVAFVWFTVLETYLQQGPASDLFHLPSTRLLISASCLFSFMLMQFYGAFIVSSMLSDAPRSIVSLQALYESSLDIGMEDIAYNYPIFINTTNQLVRKVYSQRICNGNGNRRGKQQNILDIRQGAERIREGGFAFHAAVDRIDRLLIDLLDQQQFCELQEIMFNPPYVTSSVLAKSSPWREHLAQAVLRLGETGLKQYNDRLWTVSKPDCTLIKSMEVEVDLKHFAPALFILLLAMFASFGVFLVEILLGWISVQRQLKFKTKAKNLSNQVLNINRKL